MSLINEKINYLPPEKYSIAPEIEQARNAIALRGQSITAITTADLNKDAGKIVRDIRKYVKDVEASRVALTKPLLDGQRLLKSLADEHCAPLLAEQKRLEKMAICFLEGEQRRIESEKKRQQEEFDAAQRAKFAAQDAAQDENLSAIQRKTLERKAALEASKVQAIIATPEPVLEKAHGQTMKQVLKWEVTDLMALVKARPDLCTIEAKKSAINASCHPDHPVPGLKLWFENQSTFTTR